MKETKSDFSRWLFIKYLDWQKEQDSKKTVNDFAQLIGVSRSLVDKWMNGKCLPTSRTAYLIANQFGPEVYELLGMETPKPSAQEVIKYWDLLPLEFQTKIIDMIKTEIRNP